MSGYRPSKFLSPDVLQAGVAEVAAAAKKHGVSVALVGGYAMQLYGSDRLTGDLDFVASGPLPDWPSRGALAFGGVQLTTSAGIPVDFILREDQYKPLYRAALADAPAISGTTVPVVPPPYLAAMKLASGRPRDEQDLGFLITRSGILDLARAREVIVRFMGVYAGQEFDRIAEEMTWKASRGKL